MPTKKAKVTKQNRKEKKHFYVTVDDDTQAVIDKLITDYGMTKHAILKHAAPLLLRARRGTEAQS
jgi:uncharacterized protein YcgL (UPF0745 family)